MALIPTITAAATAAVTATANTLAYLWQRLQRKGLRRQHAGLVTVLKRELRKQLAWRRCI